MHSIPPTLLTQPIDRGLPTHPIPKPRIGQGRAGLKRKIRTNQPVPLPKRTITQPMQTPSPKESFSLPEPILQLHGKVQPQPHIPMPLPHHQLIDLTCSKQPIGPKIQHQPSSPYHDPLLAIPQICVDKIIALYHASLFIGHQVVVKMYLTMKDKFIIPGLMHYLRSFIKGCHICQLARPDKPPMRQLQPQIYLNYRPLSKLSMDLKVMPRSQKGYRFILCIIDEMPNYLITVPIYYLPYKIRRSRRSFNRSTVLLIALSWIKIVHLCLL